MYAFYLFLGQLLVVTIAVVTLTLFNAHRRWKSMVPGSTVYVLRPGCYVARSIEDYTKADVMRYITAIGEVDDGKTKVYCADDLLCHKFTFWDVFHDKVITADYLNHISYEDRV